MYLHGGAYLDSIITTSKEKEKKFWILPPAGCRAGHFLFDRTFQKGEVAFHLCFQTVFPEGFRVQGHRIYSGSLTTAFNHIDFRWDFIKGQKFFGIFRIPKR